MTPRISGGCQSHTDICSARMRGDSIMKMSADADRIPRQVSQKLDLNEIITNIRGAKAEDISKMRGSLPFYCAFVGGFAIL